MRVLLIYPPISKKERYSSEIGNAGGNQIPLGIYYVASYIRTYGHEVEVIDAEATGFTATDIIKKIAIIKPEIIGISSTTVVFYRAVEVAKEIKKHYPDIYIALGGTHVSSSVDHAMSQKCFDFGILKEGEITFYHLLESLKGGKSFSEINGLVYRKDEKIIQNPYRLPVEDIDQLPFPAYDLIPDISIYTPPPCNYKERPVVNIITSRGCPNQCTFCDQSIFGQKLRQRSPENIAEEIEMLYLKYRVHEIAFVDDTFTLRPKRIYSIFKILDEKGIRLPWTCMSRTNTVDFELLKFMKEKGCWHISFGIESGNKVILGNIKKNISLEKAWEVIKWCSMLNIKTKGFFIVGHPGETIQTIDQTIRMSLRMPLDDVVVTINTPLPGTQQYFEAKKYGTLDITDWSKFNMWYPVFIPNGLNSDILIQKHKEFYQRFYLRPKIMWRYLLSFFSTSGIKRFISLIKTVPFLLPKKKYKRN